MKKLLLMVLVFVFAFTLCSCGGDLPATADPNENAMVAAEDVSEVEETKATEYNPAFSCDGEAIVPFGGYTCVDRFSREQYGSIVLYVHDSDSTKVVFNYINNQGTYKNLTANLNSDQEATVYLTDTLYLQMKFDQSTVYVDEIEGMGAMAYDFIHY